MIKVNSHEIKNICALHINAFFLVVMAKICKEIIILECGPNYFICTLQQISSKWIDSSSEGHLQGFSSIVQGSSSKVVNWMRGQRSDKSLILVRNLTNRHKKPTSIHLTSIKLFYLIFDPSFNLCFLKRNLVKLKRNLVSVTWKRIFSFWRGFFFFYSVHGIIERCTVLRAKFCSFLFEHAVTTHSRSQCPWKPDSRNAYTYRQNNFKIIHTWLGQQIEMTVDLHVT